MTNELTIPDNKLSSVLEELKSSLAEIDDIKELQSIKSMASGFEEAWKDYYRSSGFGFDQMFLGWETKVRSEKRMGQLLKKMVKNKGAMGSGSNQHEVRLHDESTPTLEDLGIKDIQSFRYQKIDDIPEKDMEAKILEFKATFREPTTAGLLQLLNKSGVNPPTQLEGQYSIFLPLDVAKLIYPSYKDVITDEDYDRIDQFILDQAGKS